MDEFGLRTSGFSWWMGADADAFCCRASRSRPWLTRRSRSSDTQATSVKALTQPSARSELFLRRREGCSSWCGEAQRTQSTRFGTQWRATRCCPYLTRRTRQSFSPSGVEPGFLRLWTAGARSPGRRPSSRAQPHPMTSRWSRISSACEVLMRTAGTGSQFPSWPCGKYAI